MQTRTPSRRSPKGSKGNLQSVIVKVDREAYRRLRIKLIEHGTTVASFMREAINSYLKGGDNT